MQLPACMARLPCSRDRHYVVFGKLSGRWYDTRYMRTGRHGPRSELFAVPDDDGIDGGHSDGSNEIGHPDFFSEAVARDSGNGALDHRVSVGDVPDPEASDAFVDVDASIDNSNRVRSLFKAAGLDPREAIAVAHAFDIDNAVIPFGSLVDRRKMLSSALDKLHRYAQLD